MTISDNKAVSLLYTLKVGGEVMDSNSKDNPLEFIYGQGYLLPKFEEYILGKEPGDTFEFTLSPKEGYGEYNPEDVVELQKSIFEMDGKIREDLLVVGNSIPMMTQDGRVIRGTVSEVLENTIKMDFNHSLAGKTLHFTGEILSVRDATEKEITEGIHGERASHGCSGNCSSCGGGCH